METDKTFATICRICLNHDHGEAEEIMSLIDSSSESGLSPYGISYEKVTKISVTQNVYLPMIICQKCKISLEIVATFMIRSETTHKKLAKLISFSKKQNLGEDMVKEVIRQYVIFNQNDSENSKVSNLVPETPVGRYVQQNLPHSNTNDSLVNSKSHEMLFKSDPDNVDIFLYSIEKLLTTKAEDLRVLINCKTNSKFTTHPKVIKQEILIKSSTKSKKYIKPKVAQQDFTCHICNRVLANPSTYRYHIERHGICRHVCDQCGKGFPVLAELTNHQIYRHGIGSKLECDQCSYKAAKRLDLIEHIRLHTGERPFICDTCRLTFRRKAIYKNHLKIHSGKTVTCEYCSRKFLHRSQMLAHVNGIHNRVYIFPCNICNITYAMAKTVRKHMLNKHGIPRHLQGKVIKIKYNPEVAMLRKRKEYVKDETESKSVINV